MKRLFELRTEKSMSQRDMAGLLHVSQTTYHNWENGITQPSINQLIAIAGIFGVSVDYLIGNSDEMGVITYKEKLIGNRELQVLEWYKALPVNMQQAVFDLLQSLAATK